MNSLSTFSVFRLLLINQWRTARRGVLSQQGVFMWVVLGIMAFYAAFTLFILGYFFDSFAFQVMPDADPVVVVNRYLLAVFVSLFFMRFLFQKTPGVKVSPYLHLPIARKRLISFFQLSSLASTHNLFPLIFFIPFWTRFVMPSDMIAGKVFWIVSVAGILLGSHFANLTLRGLLKKRQGVFYALMVLFILVIVVDETAGLGMVQRFSAFLFRRILAGDISSFALVMSVVAGLAAASTFVLTHSIRAPRWVSVQKRRKSVNVRIPKQFGQTGMLIFLEMQLMWRNRRPRHYLFVSVLFSTMYLILMLAAKNSFGGIAFDAMIGLFATGGFALNYGQLMFSWESSYFDGLISRNIPFRNLVRAKLFLLQMSCLLSFFAAAPFFLWLAPELFPLHAAFLLYNSGVTTVLVMELATRNRQAVDIEKSGSFFNYEGFSARHWLWFIPTALPPALFMIAMSTRPETALLVLAGAGMLSMMASEFWTRFFARSLLSRKYRMSNGFRSYAR